MERVVVDWMTEQIGWPEGGGRGADHGGSLANLTALLAARAAAAPDAWTEGVDGTLAVLAPPSTHYSVRRSVAMLGLGERAVVDLEVDERGADSARRARRCARPLSRGGRRPMALVAAACATSTGPPRRPRGHRRVLPRARHLVPRRRRARRVRAAVAGAPASAPRHRARRLGDLGRPQDDANLGHRGGGAGARGVAARGRLQAEGRVPDLRGARRDLLQPAGTAGRVHEGRARRADLHEPGLPRAGRHRPLRRRAVRQDAPLLGADRGARGLRVPEPARVEHPLLPVRPRRAAPGAAARAAPARAPLPPELDRGERRALAADVGDGAGDRPRRRSRSCSTRSRSGAAG